MTIWIKQHTLLTAIAAVVIAAVVCLVIATPTYINQRRQLTAAQLQHDAHALNQLAESASTIAQKLAQSEADLSSSQTELEDLINQADIIVLHLQSAPHPANLDETVVQTIQLAQIMSFSMRDLKLEATNQLKAAKTAQVMHQAASTAQTLADAAVKE